MMELERNETETMYTTIQGTYYGIYRLTPAQGGKRFRADVMVDSEALRTQRRSDHRRRKVDRLG